MMQHQESDSHKSKILDMAEKWPLELTLLFCPRWPRLGKRPGMPMQMTGWNPSLTLGLRSKSIYPHLPPLPTFTHT